MPFGHYDATQPAPTTNDETGVASNPAPATQDFQYLIYYVWSEVPPAEKPAETVLRSLKDIPVGTPVEEIKRASDAFGLDFNFMKAVAKIESGFNPNQRTGSYIGLFQLSEYEFSKFGFGQILQPPRQCRCGRLQGHYRRHPVRVDHAPEAGLERSLPDPSAGLGRRRRAHQPARSHRLEIHVRHERRQGEGREVVQTRDLGNTLPALKKAWKSVDKVTSEAFVGMWRARVAEFYSKYMATAVAAGAQQ